LAATEWKFGSEESVAAMTFLGALYRYGANGVPEDRTLSVRWFEQAIKAGSIQAKAMLGDFIASFASTTEERKRALKLLAEAAQQGNAEAQLSLARISAEGKLSKPDLGKSNAWLRKAVENGSLDASFELGMRLISGKSGLSKDEPEALRRLLPVASAGHVGAMFAVANLYEQGTGVARSYFDAYKWFLIAAQSNTNGVAQWRANNLEAKLPPEQIAEAQKQAAAFKPTPPFNPSAPYEVVPQQVASGTGVCITSSGHIATNAHVVSAGNSFAVMMDGKSYEAKLLAVDHANDLAILKIDAVAQPLPIASSSSVKLGATVATIGFPNTSMQGLSPKFSKGEIASLTGALDDPRFFQISAPVQPGNSGGALFDETGSVVGIVSNKLNAKEALQQTGYLPENVNFAVKSSLLLTLIESLPEVAAQLVPPTTTAGNFEEIVQRAKSAAVFIIVSDPANGSSKQ
jgi:S1-C subfamily serine protease